MEGVESFTLRSDPGNGLNPTDKRSEGYGKNYSLVAATVTFPQATVCGATAFFWFGSGRAWFLTLFVTHAEGLVQLETEEPSLGAPGCRETTVNVTLMLDSMLRRVGFHMPLAGRRNG